MKSVIIIVCFFFSALIAAAQGDFKKQMTTAKTSYAKGKLEEAHFALQQAMQELDIIIGKEILKLMPVKLDSLASVPKEDRVAASIGFVGTTIHRSYGRNKAEVEIISNSPLVNSVSMFLNSSFGGMMRDENTKVVKVQGYKARLEKHFFQAKGNLNY